MLINVKNALYVDLQTVVVMSLCLHFGSLPSQEC